MANVLTLEEKKNLDRRMRARFILVGALVLTIGAAVACLALLPALVSVQVAHASLNAPPEESAAARDDQQKASRAQVLVTALGSLASATTSSANALAGALALRPTGISVTAITYQANAHTIQLSGTSPRREAVNAFRDALEGSGAYSSVTVPVAALVGTQEGRFTITLKDGF